MAAVEITDAVLSSIATEKTEFIVVNFANADMLGHTENIAAAVRGVECIDRCLGRIVNAALKKHGTVLITADHGNAEIMRTPDGQPFTEHTTSPVPCIVVSEQLRANRQSLRPGILADIAPTVLELLRLPKPEGMTGTSLIS
jgi:2,3-bisphosphoglycerate-independent phosphoglycerate mutase